MKLESKLTYIWEGELSSDQKGYAIDYELRVYEQRFVQFPNQESTFG